MQYEIKVRLDPKTDAAECAVFVSLMQRYGARAGHINFELVNGGELRARDLTQANTELHDLILWATDTTDVTWGPLERQEAIDEIARAIDTVTQMRNRLELLTQLVAQLKGVRARVDESAHAQKG